jgi:hypothetical protein
MLWVLEATGDSCIGVSIKRGFRAMHMPDVFAGSHSLHCTAAFDTLLEL